MIQQSSASDSRLRRRIHFAGIVIALAHGFNLLLAPVFAIALPLQDSYVRPEVAMWSGLRDRLGGVSESLAAGLGGELVLSPTTWWWLQFAPMALASVAFAALVVRLYRSEETVDPGVPELLFRWALLFAAISFVAYPWQTRDIFLSVGMGRMGAAGLNPYHADPASWAFADIPVSGYTRMTYGPVWSALSIGLMSVLGSLGTLAAWSFKAVIAAAWIGAIRLVWHFSSSAPVRTQCLGIAIVGWLPMSVFQSIGDGHNDIVMGFLALLWLLHLREGRRVHASAALAVGVMTKYTIAPLFLVDFLAVPGTPAQRVRGYLRAGAAAAAVMVGSLLLFVRSPAFVEPLMGMGWRFMRPRDLVVALHPILPSPLATPLEWAVWAALPAVAGIIVWRWARSPTADGLPLAALAIMVATTFGGLSHVWPWFLMWSLPFAALVPYHPLARWVVGITLGSTIFLPTWAVASGTRPDLAFTWAPLAAYAISLLWIPLTGTTPRLSDSSPRG